MNPDVTACDEVLDDLADLVANDREAIARHSDHLATCDHCRDARHDATELAERVAMAGADFATSDLEARVLAALDREAPIAGSSTIALQPGATASAVPPGERSIAAPGAKRPTPHPRRAAPQRPAARRRPNLWIAIGAATALAAGAAGIYVSQSASAPAEPHAALPDGMIGKVTTIARAAADHTGGVSIKAGGDWQLVRTGELLPAGAEIRTDDRTRASLELGDGTHVVLDHGTQLAFDAGDPRRIAIAGGRVVADVAHLEGRRATITTPSGRIDVLGTRLVVTATPTLTSVQVVRGAVELHDSTGRHEQVSAGEEGVIEAGKLSV
ncbi:MAG: FecR domain-containing protein, partial [Kofleriaceae bacterium]